MRSLLIRYALPALLTVSIAACGDDDDDDDVTGPDAAVGTPDAPMGTPDAPMGTPDAADIDAEVLAGLADARAAADGATDVAIEGVFVTYTKTAVGSEVAGFFVQEAMTGPALFIAVDPATLTPTPAVGDEVTFRITEMGTTGGLRQATAIADLAVDSTGNDLSGLVQDVSAATDLVSALDDYESELVTASFTVVSAFDFAGGEHSSATVETTGVTGSTDLELRLPDAVLDPLGLVQTCALTVTATPMWRFNATAQISAWDPSEVTGTCPAPVVVGATPTSATSLEVEFDRAIDPASVTDAATQFTFDLGLAATDASVSDRIVTVTTTAQSPGLTYTLTVATSVQDIFGAAVDGAANTATFNGFGTPEGICDDGLDDDTDGFTDCHDLNCTADAACDFAAQLYLWEVDADQAGAIDPAEFIEIWNNTGAAVDLSNFYIVLLNGNATNDAVYDAVQLTGTLADGDLYVVGDDTVPNVDQMFSSPIQNGADGVLLVQCDTCTDAATDFAFGLDVGTTEVFTTSDTKTATKIDGLAHDTNDADDADLMSKVGVTAQFDEDENGNKDTESLRRTSLTGWAAGTPDSGATGFE